MRNLAPQTVLDRQQKLDAASAGADQGHTHAPPAREDPRLECLEPAEKSVDRLDRNGVLARARDIRGIGSRADVEREEIVGDRWAMAADHATPGEIEVDDLILVKPCPGKTRQRTSVDMGIGDVVVAGN